MDTPSVDARPPARLSVATEPAHAALLAAARAVEVKVRGDDDAWTTSPFGWLKLLPTATRAKAAEQIVETMLRGAGFRIESAAGSDSRIEGVVVRVKFSTLWSSGVYTFQQIRDGNYDHLILFGLSPQEAHAWVLSRSAALAITGASTSWIAIDPAAPPPSLNQSGGSLSAFFAALAHSVGSPSLPPSGPAHIGTLDVA